MDIGRFDERFERDLLRSGCLKLAAVRPFNRVARKLLDPCPDVYGMASYRKLMAIHLVASLLPEDGSEFYLEVGTFQGKSLVAAFKNNPRVQAAACADPARASRALQRRPRLMVERFCDPFLRAT